MQQTPLDRWLRKKYVYVSHVYCNTLPQGLPYGVTVEETTGESGSMYLYRLTPENDKILDELTAHLEVANITYTSRVSDNEGLGDKMLNDQNKSFTMQIAWLIFIVIILAVAFSGLPVHLWKTLSAAEEETDGKKKAHMTLVEPAEIPA
tara:strand:+ start:1471 stop:1917 length:447 start_codon:yes stop_codon:yes gene_type:complete